MAAVTGQRVADFLGRGDDPTFVALADQHAQLVTAFVAAYTRDRGFADGVPADDVAVVIVTATARLVVNPTGATSEQLGDVAHRPGTLDGWSLPELAVLHRHRRRAT
jgi:hypothetical protein